MRPTTLLTAILLVASASAVADERVSVTFLNSDQYADAGFSRYEIDANLREIEGHFRKLADRQLRSNETLAIEILDVDLAGRWDPRVTRVDPRLRVIRDGAHVPSVRLRYRLERDAKPVAGSEELVTDLAFIRRTNPYPIDEPLRYEKKMLDDWFAAEIASQLKTTSPKAVSRESIGSLREELMFPRSA